MICIPKIFQRRNPIELKGIKYNRTLLIVFLHHLVNHSVYRILNPRFFSIDEHRDFVLMRSSTNLLKPADNTTKRPFFFFGKRFLFLNFFHQRSRCNSCHFERSEEHTSELQSPCNLVCLLLLEKKNR